MESNEALQTKMSRLNKERLALLEIKLQEYCAGSRTMHDEKGSFKLPEADAERLMIDEILTLITLTLLRGYDLRAFLERSDTEDLRQIILLGIAVGLRNIRKHNIKVPPDQPQKKVTIGYVVQIIKRQQYRFFHANSSSHVPRKNKSKRGMK